MAQKSKRLVIVAVILLLLAGAGVLTMTPLGTQLVSAVTIGNLSNYFQGYGITTYSGLQYSSLMAELDYVHLRFSWKELMPTATSFDPSSIDNVLNNPNMSGKKLLLGIMWKSYDSNAVTPDWALASGYDPVYYGTEPMVNYLNTDIQNRMAWLIQQVANRYNSRNDVIYVALPGVDGENGPEKGTLGGDNRKTAYYNKWGSNSSTLWVNYMKWLADQYQTYMGDQERLFCDSYFFVNFDERTEIINYVLALDEDWGLYSMSIEIGNNTQTYSEPHVWNEYSTTSFRELEDLHRHVCRTRPCYAEHAGNIVSGIETEWNQTYRVWSALWQRMDGYGTRHAWLEEGGTVNSWVSRVADLFNTYAGKTGQTADTAWVVLRKDYVAGGGDPSRQANNYYMFLDQIDASPSGWCDGVTEPVWTFTQSGDYWSAIAGKSAETDLRSVFARKVPNCAYFKVDPHGEGFWQEHQQVRIDVVYLDTYDGNGGVISDTIELQYSGATGVQSAWIETKTEPNLGAWVTKSVTVTLYANGAVGGYDFRILARGDGPEYLHMVQLTKTGGASGETPTPTPTGAAPPTPTNTPTASPTPGPWRLASAVSVNNRYLYVYDTYDDDRADGWRYSTLSWWTEPLSTTNRGVNATFPEIAILEAQANKVVIYDPSAYNVPQAVMPGKWMQIQTGTDNALGPTTDNSVSAVAAREGIVCAGMTGSASYGVVCLDFPNDKIYRWDTGGYYTTMRNIANRHYNLTYTLADAGQALSDDQIYDLAMESLDDGDLYLLVGHQAGFDEINITDGTVRQFTYGGNDVANIAIAKDGAVFLSHGFVAYAENYVYIDDIRNKTAGAWRSTDVFQANRYQPLMAERGAWSTGCREILFGERSPLDADEWTVYIAYSAGVIALDLSCDAGVCDNSAVRLIADNYASEEAKGPARGYWPFDTSNRLYSMMGSVYGTGSSEFTLFDLSAEEGTPTYVDGVRNDAISFDGSTSLVYTPSAFLSYADSNRDYYRVFAYSGVQRQAAQSFTPSANQTLAEVWLNLTRLGTPGGDLCVSIETDDSGRPSGTRVGDQSTCIPTSKVYTTGYAKYGFQWLGGKTLPSLSSGTTYHLVVETTSSYAYSSGVDEIRMGADNSSPTDPGTANTWNGSGWTSQSYDFIYYLYNNAEAFIVDNATGTNGFSISMWLNTTQSDLGMIAGRSEWGNTGWLVYLNADGGITVGNSGGGSLTSPGAVNNGQWHHVVAVYGVGTNASNIYIDGVPVVTGTLTVYPTQALFRVGISENNAGDTLRTASRFTGSLDELMITNIALTAEDVARMYQRGNGAKAWKGDHHFQSDNDDVMGLGYVKGDQRLIIATNTGGAISFYDLNHDRLLDYYDNSTGETDYWEVLLESDNDVYGSASAARGQYAAMFQTETGKYKSWLEGTWPFPTPTATPFPPSVSTIVTYVSGVSGYSGQIDAHLDVYAAATPKGLNYNLAMRSDATYQDSNPILIYFGELNLPSGVTVDHAYLRLYTLDSSTSPPAGDVEALAILRPWVESEVTWNNTNGTPTPWASGGANGATDVLLTPIATAPSWNPTPDQTREIDIAAAVQMAVDGTPVYGVKLQFADNTARDYYLFASRHNIAEGKRPVLEVHYLQTYSTATPTPTWTPTMTPTPTGTPPTATPTRTPSPTPTVTGTPADQLRLNEIVYDPDYDYDADGEVDVYDQCIGIVWGGTGVHDISDHQLVTIVDSGRFTYTIPYGAGIFPGEKAYTRLDTDLPLTYTATTRTVLLYDAEGNLLDSKNYSNVAGYSDKRLPDLTGSWTNTQGSNCGEQNTQPTRTPTPTVSPTPTPT